MYSGTNRFSNVTEVFKRAVFTGGLNSLLSAKKFTNSRVFYSNQFEYPDEDVCWMNPAATVVVIDEVWTSNFGGASKQVSYG